VTTFTYVSYGNSDRIASVTRHDPNSGDKTWSFVYNDNASPPTTVLTDPNGHHWTYTADSGGNGEIVNVQDQLGRSEQAQYTAHGEVSQETNAAGGVTDYSWDANTNNLTEVQGPAGAGGRQTGTYEYGNTGNPYNPSAYHDQTHSGNDWQYDYDTSQDLTLKSEGVGAGQNPIHFSYSPSDGTLQTATNALGGVWTYNYTNHDLTSITPPPTTTPPTALGGESFSYDTIHRLQTSTDGKGQQTTYTYDNMDRVTQETISSLNFSFVYDGNGNLTSRTDPSGTTTYVYDALNRLVSETKSSGTIGYGYDPVGNLASVTDSNGTTTYGYDAADRLSSIHEPSAPGGGSIGYSYPDEQHVTIGFPNGASEAMTYDVAGQLTQIVGSAAGGATATNFSYAYSGDRRTSVTDNLTGTTTSYGYDPVGRLTSANGVATSYSYYYDGDGNMCAKYAGASPLALTNCLQSGSGITNYSFNKANLLITSGYNNDANGNTTLTTTPVAGTTYSFNAADQTTNVTVPGVTNLNMTYAGLGQTERLAAGGTSFVNNKLGIASRNGSDFYTRSPDSTILGERTGGSNYYYLVDGLGSVIAVTDQNGATLKDAGGSNTFTYKYDPFGKPLNDPPGSFPTQPFRYAGYYWGSTYGLYKVGERYYDPTLARWTQQDPVENPLDQHGWNEYVYAGDDPINFTDPTGLCSFSDLINYGVVGCFSKRARHVEKKLNDAADAVFKAVNRAPVLRNCAIGGAGAVAVALRFGSTIRTATPWGLFGCLAWNVLKRGR
jgi:RHS repeat-associated protein